jgi:hypothetical protein
MWIFLEFLKAFPIWLGFYLLFSHLLTFCDTCSHLICEILVINWMDVKFGMSVVDILKCILDLVPFIYHVWLLFYDWLKWMHVLMLCMSLYEFVWTLWISLTCFPWSKWAEIWYDWHVMNAVCVGEWPSKAQRNLKISPFSDPYEWAWSVIESLPLVAIQTFGADLW